MTWYKCLCEDRLYDDREDWFYHYIERLVNKDFKHTHKLITLKKENNMKETILSDNIKDLTTELHGVSHVR